MQMKCKDCGVDITQKIYDMNGPWCDDCWGKEMDKCVYEDMLIFQDDLMTLNESMVQLRPNEGANK